ncbi:MAG: hypothetical protein GY754_07305 [bacterium]|nr:hypothetical protein [bacterium]
MNRFKLKVMSILMGVLFLSSGALFAETALYEVARDMAKNKDLFAYFHLVSVEAKSLNEAKCSLDFAATICDLNVYLLMLCAVGEKELHSVMKPTQHASEIKAFEGKDGTSAAHYYTPGKQNAEKLKKMFEEWAKDEKPAVAQIKFKLTGDAHTFLIEKFEGEEKEEKVKFRVYQAYQGTYRLQDFLGFGDEESLSALLWGINKCDECINCLIPARKIGGKDRKPKKRLKGKRTKIQEKKIAGQLKKIKQPMELIGKGKTFKTNEIIEKLISVLYNGLDKGITPDEYAKTFGSTSTGGKFGYLGIFIMKTQPDNKVADTYKNIKKIKPLKYVEITP